MGAGAAKGRGGGICIGDGAGAVACQGCGEVYDRATHRQRGGCGAYSVKGRSSCITQALRWGSAQGSRGGEMLENRRVNAGAAKVHGAPLPGTFIFCSIVQLFYDFSFLFGFSFFFFFFTIV